jgi:hypothetical protein
MRSASAERSPAPRSKNVAVLELRPLPPILKSGNEFRFDSRPNPKQNSSVGEIQSKSDSLLGDRDKQPDADGGRLFVALAERVAIGWLDKPTELSVRPWPHHEI